MGRMKAPSGPPSPFHIQVTNRNRHWLEKRFGFEIPKDVEYVLAGKNMQEYMDLCVEEAIATSKPYRNFDTEELAEYLGVEIID